MIVREFLVFAVLIASSQAYRTWNCNDGKCTKGQTDNADGSISINECKATCLPYSTIWPAPANSQIQKTVSQIDISSIRIRKEIPLFGFEKGDSSGELSELLTEACNIFIKRVKGPEKRVRNVGSNLIVKLKIIDPSVVRFTTDTDESYKLSVAIVDNNVEAAIEGKTFFGVRHGLETLAQIIFFDDLHEVFKMLNNVLVDDKPAFPHRGLSVDTARNYISVEVILRLIDAMSMFKLNTFHWHLTDSHSFPYVSQAYPELSENGAYSKDKVYTAQDIENIVHYAQVRGIRVVPEFDAPAHVGEGWAALGEDLVTCFKWEPWTQYCVEPPCGQFNPTKDKVYEMLGSIFKEYVGLFKSDLFHMGGDEVNLGCWGATPQIGEWMTQNNFSLTTEGYHDLWSYYQNKSFEKLKATRDPHPQAIIWSSTLTESGHVDKYLKPEDYVIQIWTKSNDNVIRELLNSKFRLVLTPYDQLYLDCGNGAWIGGPGQNWCSPFIGWQAVYRHSPLKIVQNLGITVTDEVRKLLLGSEAAVWTEQIDDQQLEARFWPRAAALAESVWSNPSNDWNDALFRMNHQRVRLIRAGIRAELFQPEWCYQNDGFCGEGVAKSPTPST